MKSIDNFLHDIEDKKIPSMDDISIYKNENGINGPASAIDAIFGDNKRKGINISKTLRYLLFETLHIIKSESKPFKCRGDLFVYNPNANLFTDFRIGNFWPDPSVQAMNDALELNWLKMYTGINDWASKWNKRGYLWVKCTTRTKQNEEYMVANYDIVGNDLSKYCKTPIVYKQNVAEYNSASVHREFYALPYMVKICGYVIYIDTLNSKVNEHIDDLMSYNKKNKHPYIKNFFKFLLSILSIFVKDHRMIEEQEYRMLFMSTKKSRVVSEIIDVTPSYSNKKYKQRDLEKKINPWYKGVCSPNN